MAEKPGKPDAPKPPKGGGGQTPPPTTPPPAPAPQPTAAEFATLRALLTRYGLLSLYDTAVEWMISGVADSPERLELALRATPEFQARFRGLIDREQRGLPPISIDQYLAYEDQAFQLMRSYGYPPGFYDEPDDFADLIAANVSVTELEQRLAGFVEVAALGRETVRRELTRHATEAGVAADVDSMTDGDLAAWFIDPDRGLQAIRSRVRAAAVSAAASDAGFGPLSAEEGLRVGGVLEEGQARQAFGELARMRELFGRQAGERDPALGRDVALASAVGDAGATEALERRAAARRGQFQRGGGFASGREGYAGLGSS